jgi:ectoine hydroxylase-related dioxygenase (phytanoyl-CoA dioxygenase family)
MNYDIENFNELGYVIVTDFMSKEEHFNINQECHIQTALATSLKENKNGWVMNSPNNPCKLDGAFKSNDTFRGVASNTTLKSIAKKLLGKKDIDTYISKFFPMVPKEGFSVDWHQDNYYIRADSSKLISCDFFVNGATKENGCLRIIPESHRNIHDHEKESHGFFRWMNVNETHPSIIDIEMEQPFAVFFDVNLVHGCYRNTSEASYRYSIAWEYIDRKYIPKTHNGHQSQDRLRVQ